jgi:NAD(P)-dependent dehydrogenase (short-subunit alcohol dehydrogenase family)
MAPEQQTTWLVTGANRGIGLEYVTQILKQENTHVIATARTPDKADELKQLQDKHKDRLQLVKLDLADESSIKAAAEHLKQSGLNSLDYLVNNAGILGDFVPVEEQELEEFKTVLLTNVVGTFAVTKTFLPFLRQGKHKTIINTSSDAGCLTQNHGFIHEEKDSDAGMALSYRTSKVAVNMETTCWANGLKKERFVVIAIHPGFVKTDMGHQSTSAMQDIPGWGKGADLTPEESVSGMLKLIKDATFEQSGGYFKYDGSKMPW